MTTTHKERLQACLQGEQTDRPPVALWRHFPVDDQSPDSLATATLQFQKTYDFDLVKVTPASSFCLKDWGVDDAWEGSSEGTRRYTRRVVQKPQDWENLPALDPSAPHLEAQLACLRQVRAGLGPDVPMLQTVFSPFSQAKNLAGGDTLLVHLRKYPGAVMKGLETIAQSARRFVEAALGTGIDGVYYAIQYANAGLLTLEEYRTFGLPLDHRVLEPASGLWCNLLHLHGDEIYFDLASEFDFQIVNWHDRETPPTLSEALGAFGGTVCGGLGRDTLVYRDQEEVRKEARDAFEQTGGKRLILSTGCVVPVIASFGNILAARNSVNLPFARGGRIEGDGEP